MIQEDIVLESILESEAMYQACLMADLAIVQHEYEQVAESVRGLKHILFTQASAVRSRTWFHWCCTEDTGTGMASNARQPDIDIVDEKDGESWDMSARAVTQRMRMASEFAEKYGI